MGARPAPARRHMAALALVPLLALLAACGGPLGPIAGGRLRGAVVETPIDDWSFAAGHALLQIETRPPRPYSVNVGFAVAGGQLYLDIGTAQDWHRWRQFVRRDPCVRVRLGERVYAARLVAVTAAAELEVARAAFAARGRRPPGPDDAIVRLQSPGCTPRPAPPPRSSPGVSRGGAPPPPPAA